MEEIIDRPQNLTEFLREILCEILVNKDPPIIVPIDSEKRIIA